MFSYLQWSLIFHRDWSVRKCIIVMCVRSESRVSRELWFLSQDTNLQVLPFKSFYDDGLMVMIIFLYSHFILFSSLQFQRLKKYLSSLYMLRPLILKTIYISFVCKKVLFFTSLPEIIINSYSQRKLNIYNFFLHIIGREVLFSW